MTTPRPTVRSGLVLAAAAACLAALFALAFAGWIGQGSSIFLAMAQTGLSWCF